MEGIATLDTYETAVGQVLLRRNEVTGVYIVEVYTTDLLRSLGWQADPKVLTFYSFREAQFHYLLEQDILRQISIDLSNSMRND